MKLSDVDCITFLEVDELPPVSEAEEGILYRIPHNGGSGLFCKCDEYIFEKETNEYIKLEK